ncbi:OmpA family protein [Hyphococcus flavus]|uniref:OmpA family protein n=1 Tax=Hyphococcus flavus TaxID=1866326 RepID=A0AAE9ZE50_9PROT|nr:OmpA family protein [Hyphococcus flavus]WDI31357.1 OmpA family protein [Hyphococcus flavus]
MKTALKLLCGVMLVALLGLAAIMNDAMPGSVASAETKLRTLTSDALGVSAAQWADYEIDGQKIILSGEASDPDARQAVIQRIKSAGGRGGIITGPVSSVDASALVVAAPLSEELAEPDDSIAQSALEEVTAPSQEPDAPETEEIRVTEIADTPPMETREEIDRSALTAVAENDCIKELKSTIEAHSIDFASARAELDNQARAHLSGIAMIMKNCPSARLNITGHTDASGNAARNLQLSGYRADAVRTYLTSVGISASRLSAQGVGSRSPLVSNETPRGRAQNRRIEIEVITGGE